MAEINQYKDILEFVNKTCSLFDSYIEYNNSLVLKFQSLKQFGQSIIDNLNKNNIIVNNDEINGDLLNGDLINSESISNVTMTLQNELNHLVSEKNTGNTEINNGEQINYEESQPMSPSIISTKKKPLLNNELEDLKSSLDLLLEHIQSNPILEEYTLNSKENSKLIEQPLAKTIDYIKKYNLKECSVVLEKYDLSKIFISKNTNNQKSIDEDMEIERLCDIDSLLNTNKFLENSTNNNKKLKEKNKLIIEILSDKSPLSETNESSMSEDDDEIESKTQEHLFGVGLILKNDEKKDDSNENIESIEAKSINEEEEQEHEQEDEDITLKDLLKNTNKKPKNSVNTNAVRPDLAIPSDDEKKSKSKNDNDEAKSKDEEKEKRTEELEDKTKQNSNKNELSPIESSIINEQVVSLVEDDEDENEIICKVKNSNRKLRLSSTDEVNNLLNGVQEKENEDIDEVDQSRLSNQKESSNKNQDQSDSDDTIKHRKRRKRKKKSSDSDVEEVYDGDASSRESEKKKFRKIKKSKAKFKKEPRSANSDSGEDDDVNSNQNNSDSSVVEVNSEEEKEPTRHKIRNVIDDKKLAKETQEAEKAEKERIKRLKEKEQIEKCLSEANPDGVYLDVDKDSKKGLVRIDNSLVKVLKPYQLEGIRFMWNCCFESVKLIKENNKGSGCILAHCMGLGKTLQVISLVNTLLANKELTKCSRVLILMPVNVLLNWKSEFENWQAKCEHKVKVYDLPNDRQVGNKVHQRFEVISKWFNKGGVFLMGYNIFSNMVQGKNIKPKRYVEKFKEVLVNPGPDLIICDEGHLLKNSASNTAKAVNETLTKRRIVLTGTPLQNNLVEYHCMVSFVKPNLLGTLREFRNRFVNPINNGQHKDSTDADVRMMKRRAHVLHQALEGCVNRKDFCVIREFLPSKNEYVLSIRLSEKQILLYSTYLVKQRGIENISNLGKVQGAQLFTDFQMLSRIWTHPWVLKINDTKQAKNELKLAEKNFINDDDDDDDEELEEVENQLIDDDAIIDENKSEKASRTSVSDDEVVLDNESNATTSKKNKYKTRSRIGVNGGGINDMDEISSTKSDQSNPEIPKWWSDIVTNDCEFDFELSGKLVVLDRILDICQEKKDKL